MTRLRLTRVRRMAGLSLAVVGMLADVTFAQSERKEEATRSVTAPANLPFGAIAGTRSAQFILDASKDAKTGTAAFGWRTGEDSVQLSFSGPLDATSGEATPVSLLGLAGSATARISFSRLTAGAPNPLEQKQIVDICERNGIVDDCSLDTVPPADRAVFAFLNHLQDPVWLYGADIGVGHSRFKYVQRESLEAASEAHQNWSASARVGRYSPVLGFVIWSYTYQQSFEAAGGTTDICRPIPNTNATSCQAAVIGPPNEAERSVADVQVRKFFSENVAMTPSLQYDFKKQVTAIEVPVYFIGKGTNAMGGVRFGWRSDSRDLTAVVFVGAAIGLLPK